MRRRPPRSHRYDPLLPDPPLIRSHLPDINIVTPVFWDGVLRFFAANIAHHSDVGGAVPGSIAGGLKSIFEEGIRIPACRIARHGQNDEDMRSEEHTSELQSLMRISYAVLCVKTKQQM